MSARAWMARKPGPFHLTGRQRRQLASLKRYHQDQRRYYYGSGSIR
jgi:hypothetical protein